MPGWMGWLVLVCLRRVRTMNLPGLLQIPCPREQCFPIVLVVHLVRFPSIEAFEFLSILPA